MYIKETKTESVFWNEDKRVYEIYADSRIIKKIVVCGIEDYKIKKLFELEIPLYSLKDKYNYRQTYLIEEMVFNKKFFSRAGFFDDNILKSFYADVEQTLYLVPKSIDILVSRHKLNRKEILTFNLTHSKKIKDNKFINRNFVFIQEDKFFRIQDFDLNNELDYYKKTRNEKDAKIILNYLLENKLIE